jgi:hypothetical protein
VAECGCIELLSDRLLAYFFTDYAPAPSEFSAAGLTVVTPRRLLQSGRPPWRALLLAGAVFLALLALRLPYNYNYNRARFVSATWPLCRRR